MSLKCPSLSFPSIWPALALHLPDVMIDRLLALASGAWQLARCHDTTPSVPKPHLSRGVHASPSSAAGASPFQPSPACACGTNQAGRSAGGRGRRRALERGLFRGNPTSSAATRPVTAAVTNSCVAGVQGEVEAGVEATIAPSHVVIICYLEQSCLLVGLLRCVGHSARPVDAPVARRPRRRAGASFAVPTPAALAFPSSHQPHPSFQHTSVSDLLRLPLRLDREPRRPHPHKQSTQDVLEPACKQVGWSHPQVHGCGRRPSARDGED